MLPVVAYQVADSIDIRGFRNAFTAPLHHGDADELFYAIGPEKCIYVFKYGIACFLNHSEIEISAFLQLLAPFCRNPAGKRLSEDFAVDPRAAADRFGYNKIEIMNPGVEAFRLIMLNVSQSVALDFYNEHTDQLLKETNHYTLSLEKNGTLGLGGKSLKQYIGRTLNLKNRIAENLYIFDSPDETWDDEYLNSLDQGLKKNFDLQSRYRSIQEDLAIVKENLELFKDLLQYRNSNMLEWIIIILILVEVVNLFVEKVIR
jgi:required for meiotic nuclear division protein 1